MSGSRDESIVLESVAGAAGRLIELGNRAAPGHLGRNRDDSEAILWNLVVLGEATKRLSPALRMRFADVPWTQMAQTRDVVAHRYDGINWVRIGEVIYSHPTAPARASASR